MINLFRKARQRLLSKNSFLKYALYISGEVLLVIVGILIALAINNRSEERKNENKIISILKQVRQELAEDIDKSSGLIEYYVQKDSVINLVLSGTLTKEDYRSPKGAGLFAVIISANDLVTFTNGYNSLMRNVDNLPSKYEPLINGLNTVYVSDRTQLLEMNQRMANTATKTLNKWSESYVWYSSFFLSGITDEAINFALKDPFYKNDVLTYQILGMQNHLPAIKKYRIDAVESYKAITQILDLKYSEADTKDFILNNNELARLAGDYEIAGGLKVNITVNGDKIVGQAEGQDLVFELFPLSKTKFFAQEIALKVEFNLDETGKIKSLTTNQGARRNVFLKVE